MKNIIFIVFEGLFTICPISFYKLSTYFLKQT